MPAVCYLGASVSALSRPAQLRAVVLRYPSAARHAVDRLIEELGWRGVALPLLQRRLAPQWASLALGDIVAGWHAPSFFLGGTKQAAWAY